MLNLTFKLRLEGCISPVTLLCSLEYSSSTSCAQLRAGLYHDCQRHVTEQLAMMFDAADLWNQQGEDEMSAEPVPAQCTPPVLAQRSPPVPAQRSPPVPAQRSPPVPTQRSPPVPAQRSPPVLVQLTPPVPVQCTPHTQLVPTPRAQPEPARYCWPCNTRSSLEHSSSVSPN